MSGTNKNVTHSVVMKRTIATEITFSVKRHANSVECVCHTLPAIKAGLRISIKNYRRTVQLVRRAVLCPPRML